MDKLAECRGNEWKYEKLRSYQVAEAVYDATVIFCDRFIPKKSRTHDQMVQAARRGNEGPHADDGSEAAGLCPPMSGRRRSVKKVSFGVNCEANRAHVSPPAETAYD